MLFNSLDSDEGTVRFKRLPDSILVIFNTLFLIHVILCIIITINCYDNHQIAYVLCSTFIFVLSFSSIFYILFRLNGFVIFYLWSLFVGISICLIPFFIISILFPIISVIFAFIKCMRTKSCINFFTNFWLHSVNYIIFYELLFTIPHTILYNIMLFNNNQPNACIIILCIIIGILHWMMTTLYSIYIHRDQLLQLTHLLLWNTIIMQVFAIYFQIITFFLISIVSWIFWLFLFIASAPISLTYLTYKYRMHLTESPVNEVINWSIIEAVLNQHKYKERKKDIEQNIYCINHAQFHRTFAQKTKQNCDWYLDHNELDHLLFLTKHDVRLPNNTPQYYKIHEMNDDECVQYQLEYIQSKQIMHHRSIYSRTKQYFGIRHHQYYKLIILFGWIVSIIFIYFCYPLIALINAGVYDNIALQFYIVLMFVIYFVFMAFYLLLLYTMFKIQHYCGYIRCNIENQSVLSDIIGFKKILHRNIIIYTHLSSCDARNKAQIVKSIIQYLG